MKTPWEALINKDLNFADFVRFRPHTYTHTQLYVPPFIGGNKKWNLGPEKFPFFKITVQINF